MQKNILNRTIFHLCLIVVFSLIAYSNTFESPFHFDDEPVIVQNPIIKDLHYFTQPSSAKDFKGHFEYNTFKIRYIGYLTFALNYKLHGLNVTGYHLVNLSVHICTSLLLYFFILLTFKTPSFHSSAIKDYAKHIALFTALLFACHPLQTQAVTYIWQRVTSLCTLFYLLSIVAYIKWRLLSQSAESRTQGVEGKEKKNFFPAPGHAMLYLLSLIFAILAMKTKEIAFTLPMVIILYEFSFFRAHMRKKLFFLLPILLTLIIIPVSIMETNIPLGDMLSDMSDKTRLLTDIPREVYILTQMRVVTTYIRLIFLPVNQNLDYDYPIYHSFLTPSVLLSCLFLLSIFGVGLYLLYISHIRVKGRAQSLKTEKAVSFPPSHLAPVASDLLPCYRLIGFGILWFFIALSVESSVIPIADVIFEHRMYLPSVGVFIALTTAIFMVIDRWKAYARVITLMFVIIIMVLTGATYARNTVWKDKITLWQDVVNKSPNKTRGYDNLGHAYEAKGLINNAIEHYQIAIELDPYNSNAHYNLAHVFQMQGLIDNAIRYYQNAIRFNPTYINAYINLGSAYASQGFTDKAIEHFLMAIKLKPDYPKAHYNLGRAYMFKGLLNKAIEEYLLAIKFNPYYLKAHHNLGIAYKSQGKTELAIRTFNNTLRLRPGWELPLKELAEISKDR